MHSSGSGRQPTTTVSDGSLCATRMPSRASRLLMRFRSASAHRAPSGASDPLMGAGAPSHEVKRWVRTTLPQLLRAHRVEAAYLFGSWARGDADELSDIDVIVVAKSKRPFVERFRDYPDVICAPTVSTSSSTPPKSSCTPWPSRSERRPSRPRPPRRKRRGLAFFRLADAQQARVRGQSRHAEHAEIGLSGASLGSTFWNIVPSETLYSRHPPVAKPQT